jgi:putative FmdB family regulatory protein
MPTYEYFCEKCGVFEEFHGMNTTLTHCPKCNGEVRRLISRNNNIIFKGSGFYTTDYRSNSYSKKADADSSNSTTSTASPSAKSENKAS